MSNSNEGWISVEDALPIGYTDCNLKTIKRVYKKGYYDHVLKNFFRVGCKFPFEPVLINNVTHFKPYHDTP